MRWSVLIVLGLGLAAQAQPVVPGEILAFSQNVVGTLTNNSVRPGGCPTLVCTTNPVTFTRCYTNCYTHLVCTTNAAGQVQCTNVLVCKVHCYTNTFPKITCTNEFLAPTRVSVSQRVSGLLTSDGCDELAALFPSNAVFETEIFATLRTNDWRGWHHGSFKILAGTNVVARGALSGINGAGSHRGLEPCALCNHLEGTLRGQITQSGPLHGATIQAAYAGNLTDVTCPSAAVPEGAIALGIEGVVVIPCLRFFEGSFLSPTEE